MCASRVFQKKNSIEAITLLTNGQTRFDNVQRVHLYIDVFILSYFDLDMDELQNLDRRLTELKRQMEHYFLGLEKRLPAQERNLVVTAIRRFVPGNDTAQKFRHANLRQRLQTLEIYWNRTLLAIEQGRYHRDVNKANFRERVAKQSSPEKTYTPSKNESDEAADFLQRLTGDRGNGTSIPGETSAKNVMPKVKLRGRRKKED